MRIAEAVILGLDPAIEPGAHVAEVRPEAADRGPALGFADALRRHWPEYLMEAAGLGMFMISAGLFGTLLFHPASPLVVLLPDPLARRALMGAIMGATAIGLIYSPWGSSRAPT